MTVDCKNFTINCRGIAYGPGVVTVPNESVKERLERRVAHLERKNPQPQKVESIEDPEVVASADETSDKKSKSKSEKSDKESEKSDKESSDKPNAGAPAGATGDAKKGAEGSGEKS